MIEKQQIQVIHALLAKLGLANDKEYKATLVKQYSLTPGGVTSITQLTRDEAAKLIVDLKGVANKQTVSQEAIIKKRRLILHYAHQMGWEITPDPSLKERGEFKPKVDMERVNGWCVKYGQYHKPLNDHNLTELSHLIVQFERVYKDYLKSV